MITKIHKKEIIDHSVKFKTARNLSQVVLLLMTDTDPLFHR